MVVKLAPMIDQESPLRLGYIAGYGRSGSTLLDILLGQHPMLLGVGELANLSKRVWVNNEYCSCGARVRDCAFWGEVVHRFTGRLGAEALGTYARLQRRYESLAVFGRFGRLGRETAFADYRAHTEALLAILTEVSGKPVVIDSTKLPGRALSLAAMPGIDMRLIHLVRDGRGVAWSMHKAYAKDERSGIERPLSRRSVPRTAIRWAMVNLAAERVARRLGRARAAFIRYEDLVTAPAAELRKVGRLLAVDLEPIIDRLAAGAPFEAGHTVAGSRMRMAGTVRLRFDEEWMRRMPAAQQRTFQALGGWLQRRYGYS